MPKEVTRVECAGNEREEAGSFGDVEEDHCSFHRQDGKQQLAPRCGKWTVAVVSPTILSGHVEER